MNWVPSYVYNCKSTSAYQCIRVKPASLLFTAMQSVCKRPYCDRSVAVEVALYVEDRFLQKNSLIMLAGDQQSSRVQAESGAKFPQTQRRK